MKRIKFNNQDKPDFYREVKTAVSLYFKEMDKSINANTLMVIKSIIFLSLFFILYAIIITELFIPEITLILTMILGLTQTCIGFNISHDAIHGSYSPNKSINKFLGYSYDIMGLSSYIWRLTHNIVHHTYTNIPGHDEDLDIAPGLIRISPKHELKPFMKFQRYYAFLLYLLTSLSWVLRKDYKKFFQEKIGETENSTHHLKESIILFSFKGFYYMMFIVLPLTIMNITLGEFILGFILMHMAQGLFAALVFQCAHLVENIDYSEPNEHWELEESWAISQMKGTANFSLNNFFITFFCGGLNYQIEHHLFPSICHIHYPDISKIVQPIAKKHKVKYNVNSTFGKAIVSHYNMLKRFGTQ